MKHTEIGLGSTVAVIAFMGAHPWITKFFSTIALAVVSTLVSYLVQRLLPRGEKGSIT